MDYRDLEALKRVVLLAESDVIHHECKQWPMLEEKEAIKIVKEGLLKYLEIWDSAVSGDLIIDLSDG